MAGRSPRVCRGAEGAPPSVRGPHEHCACPPQASASASGSSAAGPVLKGAGTAQIPGCARVISNKKRSTPMAGRVEGKIALITRGAQGLGEAAARMLAREGARVAITDVNLQGVEKLAASLNETRPDAAIAIKHDVTSEAEWVNALNITERAFGGLHVLVNNAGIGLTKDLEDVSLQEWRRVHEIDLDGVFLGCKLSIGPGTAPCRGRCAYSCDRAEL